MLFSWKRVQNNIFQFYGKLGLAKTEKQSITLWTQGHPIIIQFSQLSIQYLISWFVIIFLSLNKFEVWTNIMSTVLANFTIISNIESIYSNWIYKIKYLNQFHFKTLIKTCSNILWKSDKIFKKKKKKKKDTMKLIGIIVQLNLASC